MRVVRVFVLVLLVLMPLLTLFAFQIRYDSIENTFCKRYEQYRDFCTYPERHEKRFLLNTNYYRHLGTIVNREEGTSPSFDSSLEGELWHANYGDEYVAVYNAVDDGRTALGSFNMQFFIAMFISVAISASTITYYICKRLMQRPEKEKV